MHVFWQIFELFVVRAGYWDKFHNYSILLYFKMWFNPVCQSWIFSIITTVLRIASFRNL